MSAPPPPPPLCVQVHGLLAGAELLPRFLPFWSFSATVSAKYTFLRGAPKEAPRGGVQSDRRVRHVSMHVIEHTSKRPALSTAASKQNGWDVAHAPPSELNTCLLLCCVCIVQ